MTALSGDVSLGSCEVVVHDDAIARFYKPFCENVLAGPALVGRQAIADAEDLFELVDHAVEGFASCVSVVRLHHSGQLLLAHGVDA